MADNEKEPKLPERYLILETLGEGAFGKVVKCFDTCTSKTVAIKTNKEKDSYEREVATALNHLSAFGVIHTDLKPDNIMIEDVSANPLTVKIIDFGLAVKKSELDEIKPNPVPMYRAPELFLGLPYDEAIDVWALGCVMATMFFGSVPFPSQCKHRVLKLIQNLLGPPPKHLLNKGRKSTTYFTKTNFGGWIPKTQDDNESDISAFTNKFYKFGSLKEVRKIIKANYHKKEATRYLQGIDLLEAMLNWDPDKRITPQKILSHHFFTPDNPNRPEPFQPLKFAAIKVEISEAERAKMGKKGPIRIMVKPAEPQNRLSLEKSIRNCTTRIQQDAVRIRLEATKIQQDLITNEQLTSRIQQDLTNIQEFANRIQRDANHIKMDTAKLQQGSMGAQLDSIDHPSMDTTYRGLCMKNKVAVSGNLMIKEMRGEEGFVCERQKGMLQDASAKSLQYP
ncbi:homeodomain-interacting protein kinase 2-like [Halichoeres trimaculatus]|uniref:homeodomain-interacting protein kinase 2-like n=1 Tax=Halichoeres trimaculatus TaxID=147232 RepID=UPI003D9E0BB1